MNTFTENVLHLSFFFPYRLRPHTLFSKDEKLNETWPDWGDPFFRMHSLSPQFSGHDHGASLDAASYGLLNEAAASEAASSSSNQRLHHISSSSSSSSTSEQHHFVHGLLEAVQHHVNTAVHHQQDHHTSPEAIMPAASNLAELKSRLCLREG